MVHGVWYKDMNKWCAFCRKEIIASRNMYEVTFFALAIARERDHGSKMRARKMKADKLVTSRLKGKEVYHHEKCWYNLAHPFAVDKAISYSRFKNG